MDTLNPPIVLEKVKVKNNINVTVVRDDYLVGGTKQRALEVFLQENKKEYIYAGPAQGFAQIALAYVTKKHGNDATLFLPQHKHLSQQTKKAIKLGAKIHTFPTKLSELQKKAKEYAEQDAYRCLLPFGLESEEFIEELAKKIKVSWGRRKKPTRMWVPAGSAVLVRSFNKVFPDCFFCIVQVGRTVRPDLVEGIKYKIYVAPEKFNERAKILPPYASVANYDAKVWQFVVKFGQDGDYGWNVGRD